MIRKTTFFSGIYSCRLWIWVLCMSGISGIVSAQTYTGDLWITEQEQVDAFHYVRVTGNLAIYGEGILNIDGLSSLNKIGGTLRLDNTLVTNIDGLSNLDSIGNSVWIWYNEELQNIDGLKGLTNLPGVLGGFSIWENPTLTHVDGLRNITSTGGRIWISSCASLENINGLRNVTSIGGDLRLGRLPLIRDLDPLRNLTTVGGGLNIFYNDRLNNLDGLRRLSSIGISLTVIHNARLRNLNGLRNTTSVGGSINIIDNPRVIHLDGLRNITSPLAGHLHIRTMARLVDIDGLRNITSVGSSVALSYNSKLRNVDGLHNLTTVGDASYPEVDSLTIRSNPKLRNLNGLQNLTTVVSDLKIVNNIRLKKCCGLYPILTGGGVGGAIIISGNRTGCDSEMEIVDYGPCTASKIASVEIRQRPRVRVTTTIGNIKLSNYPNPFSDITKFQIYLPQDTRIVFKVYDLDGRLLQTLRDADYLAGQHLINWDGTDNHNQKVPDGIYVYRLQAGDVVLSGKVHFIR